MQPLSSLIKGKRGAITDWDDSDTRFFIQRWLRDKTKTGKLNCESFKGGQAVIKAESPAVRMMVKLWEYDLEQELTKAGGPKLKDITVRW